MARRKRKKTRGRPILLLLIVLIALGGFLILRVARGNGENEVPERKPGQLLIAVDPGHGGAGYPGKEQNGVLEKDLNIKVAGFLREELEKRGYAVFFTRKEDEEIDVYARSDLANQSKADLFVSIHQNSFEDDRSVNGLETWYNPDKGDGSLELAKAIQEAVLEETGANDREIRPSTGLVVTRETQMPSCLVESGYLTNEEEFSKLTSEEYQRKIAVGIANGIDQYLQNK